MRIPLVLGTLFLVACSTGEWHPVAVSTLPVAPAPERPRPPHHEPPPAPKPPPGPTPVAGELPKRSFASFSVKEVCEKDPCNEPQAFPAAKVTDAKSPVFFWTVSFTKDKMHFKLPRDARVDVMGVVLDDGVEVKADDAKKAEVLTTWSAFRLTGGGLEIIAPKAGTQLLLAVVSDGAPIAELAKAKPIPLKKRITPLEVKLLSTADDIGWAGGAMHARLAFTSGRGSLETLLFSKDAPMPPHHHEGSAESIAVLSGEGTLTVSDQPVELKEGATVYIPKGATHSWIPKGETPFLGLQVFTPPGPEQRFLKLAGR